MGLIIMKRKLLLLTLLSIFVLGMILTPVTASHTFKKGKYKVKISDKTYNSLKKNGGFVQLPTGKYKTVKVPKYKTIWKYKNVLTGEDWWNGDDYTTEEYSDNYYWGHNWKYYGSFSKEYKDNTGDLYHVKYYTKFKKKVKVEVGTKKVKRPVWMTINCGTGKFVKTVFVKYKSNDWI